MIIDSHIHGGKLKHWNQDIVKKLCRFDEDCVQLFETDYQRLVDRMNAGGIEKGFLLAFDARRTWDSKVPNEHVAEVVNEFPDRFIGFASVDPIGGELAIQELETAVNELGLKGLKIGPTYQEYMPNDQRAYPVYELAEKYNMPMIVHQAWGYPRAPMRYALPYLLDDVALAFPKLRIIIAHLGFPWSLEALCLVAKHDHVYADISCRGMVEYGGSLKQVFRELVQARDLKVLDRILYGSDFPWLDPADYADEVKDINRYAEVLGEEPLTQAEIDGIMGGNAQRMLQGVGIEIN